MQQHTQHDSEHSRPREAGNADLRAPRRHAAQGFHRELPEERNQPEVDRQAHPREAQIFLDPVEDETGYSACAEKADPY